MNAQPAIRIQQVGMSFDDRSGKLDVLQDITADIAPQEFVCILGPSGCGKTTLLRLVGGLLQPTQGTIRFAGDQPPQIGLVFQQSNLMPWRTVLDNITLPLEVSGAEEADAQERAREMVDLVGLEAFTGAWPASLSGGMAQRVAIARAYIQDPDLLLLDEPFGSLDALTRETMGTELLRIWSARRKTVVMVTHSISEALLLADRVLVLSQRPASVKMDFAVGLNRPRSADMRYTAQFAELSRALRQAIEQ